MIELKGCAYMKKGLRILAVLVILLLMNACAEHPVDTHISSAPSGSTSSAPTVSVPKPTASVPTPTFSIPTPTVNPSMPDFEDPCSKGHTFPDNADSCSVCGVDYFSATLVFQPNSTRNGYAGQESLGYNNLPVYIFEIESVENSTSGLVVNTDADMAEYFKNDYEYLSDERERFIEEMLDLMERLQ